MPTLAQVRNFVDNRLAAFWTNTVQPREATYASNHGGRYWQGLLWVDVAALPNNANSTDSTVQTFAADLTREPTDQPVSWADAGVDPSGAVPMALAVDVYDGPQGVGYVGRVYARWNGNVYTRAQNFGPEDWRTQGWAQVAGTTL